MYKLRVVCQFYPTFLVATTAKAKAVGRVGICRPDLIPRDEVRSSLAWRRAPYACPHLKQELEKTCRLINTRSTLPCPINRFTTNNGWMQWLHEMVDTIVDAMIECNGWYNDTMDDALFGCNGWIRWLNAMVQFNGWTQWLNAIIKCNGRIQ